MEPFPEVAPPSPARQRRFTRIAILLVCTGAVALGIWIMSSGPSKPEPTDSQAPGKSDIPVSAFDNTPVIGVSIGNKYRAYALQAVFQQDSHVINDWLGDAPVSVTYCDLCDCVRVFTAPDRDRPLDISNAGGAGRRMWLRVGEHRYWQDSGLPVDSDVPVPFPYAEIEHMRTTLPEWLKLHPDSEVQLGSMGAGVALRHNIPFKIAPPITGNRER
jgi:hypothetical protein